jgi:AraC-like DNA-binding protein
VVRLLEQQKSTPFLNPVKLSTSAVRPAERLDYWNEISNEVYGPVQVRSRASGDFFGNILRLPLGGCELTSAGSTPACLKGTGTCDILTLQLMRYGHCQMSIDGDHFAKLGPGDMFLLDNSMPYTIAFDEQVEAIVVLLPNARLAERARLLTGNLGRAFSGNVGGSGILSSFLRSAWSDLQAGFSDSWSDILSDTIWNLVEMAFASTETVDTHSPKQEQMRRAAQKLIERNLCDANLGVSRIADELRVSERRVQSLFAEMATTPSKYILERRLDFAAERLRIDKGAPITEIAYAVGFNDLSYFCRAFRRRFGVSARAYRTGRVS